jgi:hypothetical protein
VGKDSLEFQDSKRHFLKNSLEFQDSKRHFLKNNLKNFQIFKHKILHKSLYFVFCETPRILTKHRLLRSWLKTKVQNSTNFTHF